MGAPFRKVPAFVIDLQVAGRLSAPESRVYAFLLRHARLNTPREVETTETRIAEHTGMDRAAVHRAIARLKSDKYHPPVIRHRPGVNHHKPSRFVLIEQPASADSASAVDNEEVQEMSAVTPARASAVNPARKSAVDHLSAAETCPLEPFIEPSQETHKGSLEERAGYDPLRPEGERSAPTLEELIDKIERLRAEAVGEPGLRLSDEHRAVLASVDAVTLGGIMARAQGGSLGTKKPLLTEVLKRIHARQDKPSRMKAAGGVYDDFFENNPPL